MTSIVTAFTAVAALVFTGESLTATREQNALAEQGLITGRYTAAVDQIGTQGDDYLQTRLGGMYARERLMTDSPRDQPTIIEVLTAFVRGNGRRSRATECPGNDDPGNHDPIKADLQAALTVLGRRNSQRDATTRIRLGLACLYGADLYGANLIGAKLDRANLAGARGVPHR